MKHIEDSLFYINYNKIKHTDIYKTNNIFGRQWIAAGCYDAIGSGNAA